LHFLVQNPRLYVQKIQPCPKNTCKLKSPFSPSHLLQLISSGIHLPPGAVQQSFSAPEIPPKAEPATNRGYPKTMVSFHPNYHPPRFIPLYSRHHIHHFHDFPDLFPGLISRKRSRKMLYKCLLCLRIIRISSVITRKAVFVLSGSVPSHRSGFLVEANARMSSLSTAWA